MLQERTDNINDNIEMKNILRERTFNSELKDLVGKITSHSRNNLRDDSISEKDKLLIDFHRLFYTTHALSESINIPEATNLFYTGDLHINSYSELLPNLFERYFASIGCRGYSILFGDYKRKCYSVSDAYYDKVSPQKTFIGLYDDILTKINSSELGYIAKDQDLNRFLLQGKVTQDSALYFIRINFLTGALKQELFSCDDSSEDNFIYSPILMLVVSKNIVSPTELFKVLLRDLPIPLYLLTKNTIQTVKPLAEDNFKTLIAKYEFILESCYHYGLNNAIILKEVNLGDAEYQENVFIMDYIFAKLSYRFPESVKFRVNPNKTIIFFKLNHSSQIKNMINEMFGNFNINFKISDILIDSDVNNKMLLDVFFAD